MTQKQKMFSLKTGHKMKKFLLSSLTLLVLFIWPFSLKRARKVPVSVESFSNSTGDLRMIAMSIVVISIQKLQLVLVPYERGER